jgi:hypothetical protein
MKSQTSPPSDQGKAAEFRARFVGEREMGGALASNDNRVSRQSVGGAQFPL